MSKRLLGIGDVYTYDYKQVHKTRNVGFGYYDPNKVSTTSSTDGYVLVDGVLSVVNEDGSNEPGPGPLPPLQPYTIRLKFKDGVTPNFRKGTGVQVSSSPNVWDLTYENSDWSQIFYNQTNLLEVIDGNILNVTSLEQAFYNCQSLIRVNSLNTEKINTMKETFSGCRNLNYIPSFNTPNLTKTSYMFYNCTSLNTVPLFDTSNVTTATYMFGYCRGLTSVPLFDTGNMVYMGSMFKECNSLESLPLFNMNKTWFLDSFCYNCSILKQIPLISTISVVDMEYAFKGCYNVESGALALYQQVSTQTIPPSIFSDAFLNCGSNTETGAEELAQIPTSWGGTMQE